MKISASQRIAEACARRPWLTIGSWVIALVAGLLTTGALLSSAISTEVAFISDPDSKIGTELIDGSSLAADNFTDTITVSHPELTIDDAAFRTRTQLVLDRVQAVPSVEAAVSYYDTENPGFVSQDRHTTIIPVAIPVELQDDVVETLAIVEELDDQEGFSLTHSGQATLSHDFNEQSERDLRRGESIGVSVALVILLLVFGALIAGVLPVILAIISIVIGLGIVSVIGQTAEFSFFVVNLMTMMGLAVGIDYSLFIVSRYREERATGKDVHAAIGAAGGTASKAVFFSGVTVVVSLAGLLLVPNTIFVSLGAGAVIVVLITILQAQTLLPAVLGLLGDRINKPRVPFVRTAFGSDAERGFFSAVAGWVQRHPIFSLISTVAVLLIAATPLLSINTGFSGVSTLPDGFAAKEGFELLQEEFDAGQSTPAQVVLDGDPTTPDVAQALSGLRADLEQSLDLGVPSPLAISDDGQIGLVQVPLAHDPQTEAAYAAVRELRDDLIPRHFEGVDVGVYVAGQTAEDIDFIDQLGAYTVPVIALVLTLSVILLVLAFRSIVIAIKSIIVTLLSVLAAYGILVLVFQQGVGNELFGFQQVEKIEAWIPLFLFALLFGLSMDYQVFLVSRIQERWNQTKDNDGAVRWGVGTTARLITGAAAIMIAVFGGFALGELVPLAEMGFGLAVAIAIDALIVRTILVPAAMTLLGGWNWYLPSWLEWLPDLKIEGEPLPEDTVATPPRS